VAAAADISCVAIIDKKQDKQQPSVEIEMYIIKNGQLRKLAANKIGK